MIDLLRAELHSESLPGPFNYGVTLSRFTPGVFHTRSRLGALIRRIKSDYSAEAADTLAALVVGYLRDNPLPSDPDLILTVPDSIARRPVSPVACVAEKIGLSMGWAVRDDLLVVVRDEKPQKERSVAERLSDRRPRYALRDPGAVAGRTILLFDDICVTGRSLAETVEHLRAASARLVMALTLAKLDIAGA
jgi:predicted amidophosphoribosyltransferase